jgi:hypothetical protein
MTNQAFASYSFQNNSIIVDIESTNPNLFRSFRVDGRTRALSYEHAYTECSVWASAHGLQLEVFRAG